MPTYEYECTKCGHAFEASQKMTDKPLSKCPKCEKKLRRLIGSGGGIIFKGPGFYATDYKKKSTTSAAIGKCHKEKKPECHSCPASQS